MTMIETSTQLKSGTLQSGLYGVYRLVGELCGEKDVNLLRGAQRATWAAWSFSATRRRRLWNQAPSRRTKLSMCFIQRAAKLGREERVAKTESARARSRSGRSGQIHETALAMPRPRHSV